MHNQHNAATLRPNSKLQLHLHKSLNLDPCGDMLYSMKHIRSPKVRIKWWRLVQLHDIFTSFQQAVSVSILHQVAIYGDVVQGLQRGALLHIFIGHRETGLGAIPHQTTTTTHTHTRAHEEV